MLDTNSHNQDYLYLLKEFGEDVLEDRFAYVYSKMEDFINDSNLSDKLIINEEILGNALVDYFADIQRLKEFHGIEYTQKEKCIAYLTYWLLYRKPIQTITPIITPRENFVNEKFVYVCLLMAFLNETCNIAANSGLQEYVQDFGNTCLYYLKYRRYSPQAIELMLYSFKAGLCCEPNR